MSNSTVNRIERDQDVGLHFEFPAVAALKPGHIVEQVSTGKVQKHSIAGQGGEYFVALENAYLGTGVTSAYAADDVVFLKRPKPGARFYGRLPANCAAITRGSRLMSAGDGTFMLFPSTGNKLYTNAAASTAVSNTVSTEQFYDVTYTLPANVLQVGDVLNIKGYAVASATASTDTITVKVYVGSIAVVTTAAVDAATGDIVEFEVNVVIRTIGASGTMVAWNTNANGVPATGTVKSGFIASSAVDTTATNLIRVSSTWSATTATCTSALQALVVTLNRGTGFAPLVVADESVDNSAVAAETFIAVRSL